MSDTETRMEAKYGKKHKRIVETRTFFLTRDELDIESTNDMVGGLPSRICLWKLKKPKQDVEGNWDSVDETPFDGFDLCCSATQELSKAFGVKFEKGICIKIQIDVNRKETIRDALTTALNSDSAHTKDAAIKAALDGLNKDAKDEDVTSELTPSEEMMREMFAGWTVLGALKGWWRKHNASRRAGFPHGLDF